MCDDVGVGGDVTLGDFGNGDIVGIDVDIALGNVVNEDVRVAILLEVNVNDDVDDAVNDDLLNHIVRDCQDF